MVGTPYANRDPPEVEGLLGTFVKCVVLVVLTLLSGLEQSMSHELSVDHHVSFT